MTQNINAFKEKILRNLADKLGINNLPTETRDGLVAEFGENVMMRLTTEILRVLPEEKHQEFVNLMENGNMQGIHDSITPHIPDFDSFVHKVTEDEIADTKAEM
jgi:hypothetical protein